MASWRDSRRTTDRRVDYWLTLAVLVLSVFIAGLFVGSKAFASPPPSCNRVYPAPATIINHGQLVPLHPALRAYAQCVRGRGF